MKAIAIIIITTIIILILVMMLNFSTFNGDINQVKIGKIKNEKETK